MPERWIDTGRFDLIEKTLAKQPFLSGDTFTVADAYLFNMLVWADHTGIDRSKWPAIVAFFERVSQRPAVKAALEAEKPRSVFSLASARRSPAGSQPSRKVEGSRFSGDDARSK